MSPKARTITDTNAKPNNRLELIINAAAQMFNAKGYAATSTQDIADEVGLLKGSIYYYINNLGL